jgi:YspA, cpYpsA-related SLOG family
MTTETKPYRVLVTGSRNWSDERAITYGLTAASWFASAVRRPLLLVHGACPTGADALAHKWAVSTQTEVEQHPADWKQHGKAAGPLRNREMVSLGADLCLAFPLGESIGTYGCMILARGAWIPVINLGESR